MRRLWIAIAIVLMLSGQVWAAKQSNEIADITYLLRCWPTGLTVADQSYINNQDINTSALGCLEGSLSATQTPLSSSNKFTVDSLWDGANAAVTRAIGRMVMATLYGVYDKGDVVFGLSASSNDDGYPYNHAYYGIVQTSDDRLYFGASYILIPSLGSTAKCAFVLGGYNSSCVPYKDGDTKSNFGYGASYFIDNTLVWKDCSQSTSSLYMSLTRRGAYSFSADKIQIPSYDFSAVLQPTVLDTFTGADGTSLADHTPDVGGAWTVQSGAATIQSNKAQIGTAGISTLDTSLTTGMYDVTVTMPGSGTTAGGLIARYVDATHYWYVALILGTSNNIVLNENDGGVVVARSTASATLSASTAYAVRLIVSSTSPYWTTYVGGVAKNSYATVGSSSTATKFGIYDDGNANITGFDVAGFWPLTSTTYTSEFAKVGY